MKFSHSHERGGEARLCSSRRGGRGRPHYVDINIASGSNVGLSAGDTSIRGIIPRTAVSACKERRSGAANEGRGRRWGRHRPHSQSHDGIADSQGERVGEDLVGLDSSWRLLLLF